MEIHMDTKVRRMVAPSPTVFSIPEFCGEHRISRSMFYKELKAGRGPRLMKVGGRVLITAECAEAWRQSRLEPVPVG
jgi:predicted DNA-binding transcriptional regulator AlpA